VKEGGRDRLLIEAQAGADRRDADGVGDERLAGAAVLPLVSGGGEPEGARDELDVDVGVLSGELGEQPLEELFVPLAGFKGGHFPSVLPGFRANPRGRNGR